MKLFQCGSPVQAKLFDDLEAKRWPVPAPFKSFIGRNNGGLPMPAAFHYYDFADRSRVVGAGMVEEFYCVKPASGVQPGRLIFNGLQTYFEFTKDYPQGLIAVAKFSS
ncbi:MAG: hypothetical protein ACRC1K_19915 [Planctomycetia bacterium]